MYQYVQIKIARCFIRIFKLKQGARRSCNCIATSSYILQFCLIFKFPKCAFKANFESSKIFEMVEPFREEPTQRSKVTVTNIYLKLGQVVHQTWFFRLSIFPYSQVLEGGQLIQSYKQLKMLNFAKKNKVYNSVQLIHMCLKSRLSHVKGLQH